MITGDDIRDLEENEENKNSQLVVIDTMQFFEIKIPKNADPEVFIESEECRKECAALILNQTTDLQLECVLDWDEEKEEWD